MNQETENGNGENLEERTIQREQVSNKEETDKSEIEDSGAEISISSTMEPRNFAKIDFLGGGDVQFGNCIKETETNKSVTPSTIPIIVIEEPEESEEGDCDASRISDSVPEELPVICNADERDCSLRNSKESEEHNNTQNNCTVSPPDDTKRSEGRDEVERDLLHNDIAPEEQTMKNGLLKNEGEIELEDEDNATDYAIKEVNNFFDCNEGLKTDEVKENEKKLREVISEDKVCDPEEMETNEHRSEAEDEKPTDEAGNGDPQKNRSRTYPYKVFVFGLPLTASLEDITSFFSRFGEVLKTFNEGRHKANIIFSDAESVKKAVFCPDPYFDDHKLLIKSVNEVTTVINGIPQSMLLRDAEKAIRKCMEEADVPVCRVSLPLSDSNDFHEKPLLQGHAFVVFCDQQTLQKAEEKQKEEPFIVADTPVVLFPSINQFYKQFCVRVYPLPSEHPRCFVYHQVRSTLSKCGDIISQVCVYVQSSSSYAVYVLFVKEEAVKSALEMTDVKILDQFVEVQEFHPFETGQGFRHLWLKILNLPPRVTVTEVKHHFGHDKGIIYIELDMDFGSCFIHVDSEHAIQRCLRMHQTYFRGKCITVMIADEHPGKNSYFRGGRQNNRNRSNYNRNMKRHMGSGGKGGYNGMTYTSGQNSGTQERRGYDWKERKFSKLRNTTSEGSQQSQNSQKTDGGEVKAIDNAAA